MEKLASTSTISFERAGCLTHRLRTRQTLPLSSEEAFRFFEDPANLSSITPKWLDFTLPAFGDKREVCEGAEFHYTIRWFGITLPWRSRIVDYAPPLRFTDIQIFGPYRSWRHLHTFKEIPDGTLMEDEVTYRLPLWGTGLIIHELFVRRQLEEIFS